MPNITYSHAIICLYYYPRKVCNLYMQVFQIKLKYHCSEPIKLQKFLVQLYKTVSPHDVLRFLRNRFRILFLATAGKKVQSVLGFQSGQGRGKRRETLLIIFAWKRRVINFKLLLLSGLGFEIPNTAQGTRIPLTIGIQIPSSSDKESRILECLRFPHIGRVEWRAYCCFQSLQPVAWMALPTG